MKQLVIGRVVDLAGGKARVATFPVPKPARTEREKAVIEAAIAFVNQFEATKQAAAEYRALQAAIRDL